MTYKRVAGYQMILCFNAWDLFKSCWLWGWGGLLMGVFPSLESVDLSEDWFVCCFSMLKTWNMLCTVLCTDTSGDMIAASTSTAVGKVFQCKFSWDLAREQSTCRCVTPYASQERMLENHQQCWIIVVISGCEHVTWHWDRDVKKHSQFTNKITGLLVGNSPVCCGVHCFCSIKQATVVA